MRLKHRTFVEKYIEKIILAVGVLIAAGIVYFYVAGDYSVALTGSKKLTGEEVERDYKAKVSQLEAAVTRPDAPAEVEKLSIPKYSQRFWDRYKRELVTREGFYHIAFGHPGVPNMGAAPPDIRSVKVVEPPAAKDLVAAVSNAVLVEDEVLNAWAAEMAYVQKEGELAATVATYGKELAAKAVQLTGGRNPRDFHYATVTFKIDPQERREAYRAVPAAEGKMEEEWFHDQLEIVTGIKLQRQTLIDPVAGTWGTEEEIAALPGSVSYLIQGYAARVQEAQKAMSKDDAELFFETTAALVQILKNHNKDIVRPGFLPHKPHRPWRNPEDIIPELSPADQLKLFKLNGEISELESKIRQLHTKQAVDQKGLPTRVQGAPDFSDPTKPPKRPPVGATPKPPVGSPLKPPGTPDQPKVDPITELTTKLTTKVKDRDELLGKLKKDDKKDPKVIDVLPPRAGIPPRPPEFNPGGPGRPFDPARPFDPNRPGRPAEEAKLLPIECWVHDVTAQPGKTYRYRVSYSIINPLFNRGRSLVDAQKEVAERLEQASPASAWSKPVSVDAELRYFVEDVKPENNMVTWGVYRLFNGYRVFKQFPTRPGDPIGKVGDVQVKDDAGATIVQKNVDMTVPAMLVDVKSPARLPGALGARGPITVLVADLETGAMSMRDPTVEKTDRDRIRLYNEATAAPASSTTTPGIGGASGILDPRDPRLAPGPGGLPPGTGLPGGPEGLAKPPGTR